MGGLCKKLSVPETLLSSLPSQFYQHTCRAVSIMVSRGHADKLLPYVTAE